MPTVRKRPMVRLTLAPETWERLGRIADRLGLSRSKALDDIVAAFPMPAKKKETRDLD